MSAFDELNDRQRAFVEAHVKLGGLNQAQAAVEAGYSAKTAYSQASRLLKNVKVAAAVKEKQTKKAERIEERTAVDASWVVSNLVEVAERCMQKRPVRNMRGEQVVDEEGNNLWTFDAKGANRALELIGKHVGCFVEKVESKEQVQVVYSWQE